jgi:hypothetical protein
MSLILLTVFLIGLYASVCFRLTVMHPISFSRYLVTDIYKWFKYCKWNNCHTGKLICYTALFGKGKTLSVVHYINSMYRKYNNKKVYDFNRRKWVMQKVHIISNVDLNIPYEKFVSLEQIVRVSDTFKALDDENDTLTVTLVLGDEFSVQMNSRSFKSNIDPLFLNTLLTCRHHHITLVYNAQRFNHVDALLRQVTTYVVNCDKVWRFQIHRYYDAYQLENASDPTLVKPFKRDGFFITDRDYNAYDTLACVGNLKKAVSKGDMLSEADILALQQNTESNPEVVNPSGKFKRLLRKRARITRGRK